MEQIVFGGYIYRDGIHKNNGGMVGMACDAYIA